MQDFRKQYTITITGRVQEVEFRGFLADLCKRLRVPSIAYNSATEELKLLCEAERDTIETLVSWIREYRLGEIRDLKVAEGVQLPYPPFRAVSGIEEEIYGRLDEGVKLLNAMNSKLDKLDEIAGTLKEISNKLKMRASK